MYIIYAPISDGVHANTISWANTANTSTFILKLTSTLSLSHRDNSLDYLEFRLWIGLWSAIFCLVLVATDASFLVQYFTRFTEEGFSALISFIFIYDAFKKMIKLGHYHPINADYDTNLVTQYDCRCMPGMWSSHGWTGHVKMVNSAICTVSSTDSVWYQHSVILNHPLLQNSSLLIISGCHQKPDSESRTAVFGLVTFGSDSTIVCWTKLSSYSCRVDSGDNKWY